jgi:LmbE family N-acetylglucosaminyl deacetylase
MNMDSMDWPYQSALVIVAHPDDEILWAGGTILSHPETRWQVTALCRRNDLDRAPRFQNILKKIGASGELGDLDDGPEQTPLRLSSVQSAVMALAGDARPDLIITHSVAGEYMRHRRHEEIGAAVLALWDADQLPSRELWTFAYRDAHAIAEADMIYNLPPEIRDRKHRLMTDVYGFTPDSFEAKAASYTEAFWRLRPNKEPHL